MPWGRTTRETALWSGSDEGAEEFVKLPEGAVVRPLDTSGGRTLVYFGGDVEQRRPGEAWIDTADLASATWPRWVRSRRASAMRSEPRLEAASKATLPRGTYLEIVGDHSDRWARAFYLGDGRTAEPLEGWVDVVDFARPPTPQDRLAAMILTREMLAQSAPDVWLRVPYRAQMDGSPYADANCGPTTVAMALEAFGQTVESGRVRLTALEHQGTPGCDSCGLFIESLAAAAEARGLPTHGLTNGSDRLKRWSIDDIRARLRQGHLVVPQVEYRSLPGRTTSGYRGDHYVVLTGIIGDRFIFNDPIDGDAPGYGRVVSAEALTRAMARSDFPHAAFAAGR